MPQDKVALDNKDRKAANEAFNELAPSFSKDTDVPTVFNANVSGLEPLAEKLNEVGKKILNVILTDFSAENECEAEKEVFKKLRNACARAGMLGTGDEREFFKILADPQFNNIVKTTGQGLIGMYIVPIVTKVIEQAMSGDKTSQKWALEITGILQGKYDFYLNRYNLTHNVVNAENINFDGKTDADLAKLVAEVYDASEADVSAS